MLTLGKVVPEGLSSQEHFKQIIERYGIEVLNKSI